MRNEHDLNDEKLDENAALLEDEETPMIARLIQFAPITDPYFVTFLLLTGLVIHVARYVDVKRAQETLELEQKITAFREAREQFEKETAEYKTMNGLLINQNDQLWQRANQIQPQEPPTVISPNSNTNNFAKKGLTPENVYKEMERSAEQLEKDKQLTILTLAQGNALLQPSHTLSTEHVSLGYPPNPPRKSLSNDKFD